ncbi:hypothetical protein DFH06DRAFT_1177118 [Mycena polygramma]|nr:hypothetical protein DFH06DRAFT_1177118 [Mycena polygramma]
MDLQRSQTPRRTPRWRAPSKNRSGCMQISSADRLVRPEHCLILLARARRHYWGQIVVALALAHITHRRPRTMCRQHQHHGTPPTRLSRAIWPATGTSNLYSLRLLQTPSIARGCRGSCVRRLPCIRSSLGYPRTRDRRPLPCTLPRPASERHTTDNTRATTLLSL